MLRWSKPFTGKYKVRTPYYPISFLWTSELPTYDLVIPALLEVGIDGLKEKCSLTPGTLTRIEHYLLNDFLILHKLGVPLKPMLAKPTKAIGEVLDRFENKRFTCEYKYDGERAQVSFKSS